MNSTKYLFLILFITLNLYATNKTISNTNGKIIIDDGTYNAQGQDYREKYIIIHYTAIDKNLSIKTLTEKDVSSHFLITDEKKDPVYSLVPEGRRAWHAGVSEWGNSKNLNDSSIGIEIVNLGNSPRMIEIKGASSATMPSLEGTVIESEYLEVRDYQPYEDFQIEKLAVLLKYLTEKYQILPTNILGHSDIAPQRKPDPGPLFPWKKLYTEYNIGMWYDESVNNNIYQNEYQKQSYYDFQKYLKQFGYSIELTGNLDKQTKTVITAFQHHFRPSNYDGTMDYETYNILRNLINKYNK